MSSKETKKAETVLPAPMGTEASEETKPEMPKAKAAGKSGVFLVAEGMAVMINGAPRGAGEMVGEEEAECARLVGLGYLVKA